MLRFLAFILILFVAAALVLYATDSVRRYGPAILTAALGLITSVICVPVSAILGLMYATGSAGEAAYALRELRWMLPVAGVGVLLLASSMAVLRRRGPPAV